MRKKELARLVAGFRRFKEKHYDAPNSMYRPDSGWVGPKTLVIGCSDSRVDPAIISDAGPGELFVVRNVANLIPPFETGGNYHGTSAAIEFAIVNLKVENVIILGHWQCGGIRALVTGLQTDSDGFIDRWVAIARPAHFRALARFPDADQESLCHHCELESIKTSIENLRTFPFVQNAVKERGLNIIGAYFNLERGSLLELVEETGEFRELAI